MGPCAVPIEHLKHATQNQRALEPERPNRLQRVNSQNSPKTEQEKTCRDKLFGSLLWRTSRLQAPERQHDPSNWSQLLPN